MVMISELGFVYFFTRMLPRKMVRVCNLRQWRRSRPIVSTAAIPRAHIDSLVHPPTTPPVLREQTAVAFGPRNDTQHQFRCSALW